MRTGRLDDTVTAVNDSGSPSAAQLADTQNGDDVI